MHDRKAPLTALTALAVIFALALPALACASSYTTTLDYTWRVFGSTRSYTHDDMNLSGTFATTNGTTGTHTATLWRDRSFPLSDQNLGARTLTRKGYSNVDWYDVGAGKYYFNFLKSETDGVRVYCNSLSLYCD